MSLQSVESDTTLRYRFVFSLDSIMVELTVLVIAVAIFTYCAVLYSFRLFDGLVKIGRAGAGWLRAAHR